jgi:hypothetical protein
MSFTNTFMSAGTVRLSFSRRHVGGTGFKGHSIEWTSEFATATGSRGKRGGTSSLARLVRAEARRDDGFDAAVRPDTTGCVGLGTARQRMRLFEHCRAARRVRLPTSFQHSDHLWSTR